MGLHGGCMRLLLEPGTSARHGAASAPRATAAKRRRERAGWRSVDMFMPPVYHKFSPSGQASEPICLCCRLFYLTQRRREAEKERPSECFAILLACNLSECCQYPMLPFPMFNSHPDHRSLGEGDWQLATLKLATFPHWQHSQGYPHLHSRAQRGLTAARYSVNPWTGRTDCPMKR